MAPPDPNFDVDAIYNLACPASPAYYQRHPVQTTLTCGSASGACSSWPSAPARGCCRPRPARSTATRWCIRRPSRTAATSTRSARARATTKASAAPRRCASPTTASAASTIRIARHLQHLRPAPAPGDGRVVSNFIVQALRGEPLTVYGDGLQTRSFCYVDDTVEGLLRLMDGDVERPVNIGNPDRAHGARAGRARAAPDRQPLAHSCTGRCRRTTRTGAGRTSRARAASSAGSRAWPRRRAAAHDRLLPHELQLAATARSTAMPSLRPAWPGSPRPGSRHEPPMNRRAGRSRARHMPVPTFPGPQQRSVV